MTSIRRISEVTLIIAICALLLLLIGCSRVDSPTSSQSTSSDTELWNPQPGDHVVPDHEVPLLRNGYWESLYGQTVNPWQSQSRAAVITSAGGMIPLGPHMLLVPPDAVSRTVVITISYASETGIALDCNPSPYTFDRPITLILSYRGTQYEGGDSVPPLGVYYLSPDGSYELQPSVTDPSASTVRAEISHFSRYILG